MLISLLVVVLSSNTLRNDGNIESGLISSIYYKPLLNGDSFISYTIILLANPFVTIKETTIILHMYFSNFISLCSFLQFSAIVSIVLEILMNRLPKEISSLRFLPWMTYRSQIVLTRASTQQFSMTSSGPSNQNYVQTTIRKDIHEVGHNITSVQLPNLQSRILNYPGITVAITADVFYLETWWWFRNLLKKLWTHLCGIIFSESEDTLSPHLSILRAVILKRQPRRKSV